MPAAPAMPGCFSTWFSSVVLPLPRNPVSTVTGMREASSLSAMGGLSLSPRRLSRETPAASRATVGFAEKARISNYRAGKNSLFPAYDRVGGPRGCGRARKRGRDVSVVLLGRHGDLCGVDRGFRLFGLSPVLASTHDPSPPRRPDSRKMAH